ncbi:MAG TPA: glycosyltransferase family 87 protein [Caulobacteraceae bacterium]|nr:glycosyltransferase family 87 protein [Caulobacteraceae bacterium]
MGRWTTAWTWLRIALLSAGVLVLAWLGWRDLTKLFAYQPAGIDFLPMWAAAHEVFVHPHRVYDFARLTHFEQPMLRDFPFRGLRPFVYPPPALLIFVPFGQAPFGVANLVWTLAGLVAIVWTTATRVQSPRVLALLAMVLTPASLLVLATGQVTFLIAAMGLAALLSLEARPMLAGVLFGVAGAIKPQALLLLPVALFAIGAWRTFAMTALTAALVVLASAAIFGLQAWIDWLAAVSRFGEWAMRAPGLVRGMITPTALGMTMKLDPAALDTWRLGFGCGAIAMVWFVFRRTSDAARRLAALFGGAIFVTPYAMHYDAALLAPAAALIVTCRTRLADWLLAIFASALLCCAAIPHWGAAGVTAFILIVSLTPQAVFVRRPALADLGREPQGEAAG